MFTLDLVRLAPIRHNPCAYQLKKFYWQPTVMCSRQCFTVQWRKKAIFVWPTHLRRHLNNFCNFAISTKWNWALNILLRSCINCIDVYIQFLLLILILAMTIKNRLNLVNISSHSKQMLCAIQAVGNIKMEKLYAENTVTMVDYAVRFLINWMEFRKFTSVSAFKTYCPFEETKTTKKTSTNWFDCKIELKMHTQSVLISERSVELRLHFNVIKKF